MMLIALALLQAVPPAEDQTAAQPAPPPAQEQPAADDAPEPKMKRVCRKVMDPRVNTLAGRQTVCKFVPADEPTVARK